MAAKLENQAAGLRFGEKGPSMAPLVDVRATHEAPQARSRTAPATFSRWLVLPAGPGHEKLFLVKLLSKPASTCRTGRK